MSTHQILNAGRWNHETLELRQTFLWLVLANSFTRFLRKRKSPCAQTNRVVVAAFPFSPWGEAEYLSLLSSLPAESCPRAKSSKLHAEQQACRWILRNSANPASRRSWTWRPGDLSPCQLSILALASRRLSETCIYKRQTAQADRCLDRNILVWIGASPGSTPLIEE